MSEPRQPGAPVVPEAPEPRPDRLQRWFAAEVRAAEQDVKRGLLAAPRPWIRRGGIGRRGFAGGAVAATGVVVLLVVALATGFLGGAVGPSPSAGASGATSTAGIAWGANGIPVSIDGEPVLTPSAALARAQASTDATTFLVGGWLVNEHAACPAPTSESPALLFTGLCGGQPALFGSPAPDAQGRSPSRLQRSPPVGRLPGRLEPADADPREPPGAVRPRRRAACAHPRPLGRLLQRRRPRAVRRRRRRRCRRLEGTVGPSAVPYPSGALFADGIPSTLDGQPVLRPTQAAAQAVASTDASTFLVGGWVTGWFPFPYSSCPRPTGSEADQVLAEGPCCLPDRVPGHRRDGAAAAPLPARPSTLVLGPRDPASPYPRPARHLLRRG